VNAIEKICNRIGSSRRETAVLIIENGREEGRGKEVHAIGELCGANKRNHGFVSHSNVTAIIVTDWGTPDFREGDAGVISPANPTLSAAPQFCRKRFSGEFYLLDL
jgi:hypothetical protein